MNWPARFLVTKSRKMDSTEMTPALGPGVAASKAFFPAVL